MVLHALRKIPAHAACLALALAALTVSATAQESRYLVVFPATITSGQYAGDVDLFSALFGADATMAWTAEQPHAVAAQSYREFAPAVAEDPNGTWLAYTIEHTDSSFGGDQDILLRRIDRFGENLLGDSATSFAVVAQSKFIERNPHIVRSDGGLLVFYEVFDRETGSLDVAAVRVDDRGSPAWASGVMIARSVRRERLVDAVSDGRGGAIAIIEASAGADTSLLSDIIAVHIDAAGRMGWGASGDPVLLAASRHIERNPSAVADGLGGAYVAYEIEYTSGARQGDRDVLAQHLTAQGAREWVSETALPIVSSVPNAAEKNPMIARDTGGIVIAFEMDFHSEKRPVKLIGVQRMDLSGRLTWNKGKKPEVVMVPERIVENGRLLSDLKGGIFLVAEARDTVLGDVDVYVQKFTSDGVQLWANGELPVAVFNSDRRERAASAVPDNDGGIIVVAAKDFIGADGMTNRKIVAQRIAADGRHAWLHLGGPLLLTNTTTQDNTPSVFAVD